MINIANRPFIAAVSVSAALLLGACSSGSAQMDTGERISARGASISERGDAWTQGERDVRDGKRLVAKGEDGLSDGEKRLKRAQDQVARAEREITAARADTAKGERLVSDGTSSMAKAQADYAAIRSGPSAIAPR